MAPALITVKNISKSFEGVRALKGIDLEIAPGEIHCLAGENGSGKSTLIKILSGVYEPDCGTIEVDGKTWTKMTPLEAIGAGIQVIYQDFSVFPNLSVMENLALTSEVAHGRKLVNWKHMRSIAKEAISKIGFTVDLDAKVGELSVADKQLVAICRALMSDAKLIVMDEPTTALTKHEVDALFAIITDLKARGIATLFVSHKLEEVFEISERFTILRSGEKVITCDSAELDRHKFATYMTGKEFTETRFDAPIPSDEPVLEVSHLCVEGAFHDVSFTLRSGEMLGITGLLGSGRTELALALFGLLPASSGSITVKGKEVHLTSVEDAIKSGIALVPEDRLTEGLFLTRSIGENIVISKLDSFAGPLGVLDKKKIAKEESRWVKELGVATPNYDNAVNTLSGGNQQKVVLAKWLATTPDILILNGPTVGVDIGSKYTIHSILHNLAQKGMAILIISDDIAEVLTNCSSVLIMRAGQICDTIDPATTSEAELGELVSCDVHVTTPAQGVK